MKNTRLFKLMQDEGFEKVIAEFSGGNDEGGVDDVYAYKANGERVELELPSGQWNQAKGKYEYPAADESKRRLIEIYEIMEGPVENRYGGFGFEGYVSGRVVAERKTGTFAIEGQAQEYVPFSDPL